MRPLFLTLLLLPLVVHAQQDEVVRTEREELVNVERVAADRGPIDHLGWGTAEDLYVDLGAGAAVAVLSGDLVVSVPTFLRPALPSDTRLALTYNHLDSGGAPEIAPGWSWDLGRGIMPGAWGDMVLVDSDGFRDSFFAGEPPTTERGREVTDALVKQWKRSTPASQRRDAGGEGALRDMLASDPLLFGELRTRFLGPAPEPEGGEPWVSEQRGRRSIERSMDRNELILGRHDGGEERYSREGRLLSVRPGRGPSLELDRENGRLVGVNIDGARAFHVQIDGWNRIQKLRATDGEEAELDYLGTVLHQLDGPMGAVRFSYDGRGRLMRMVGPEGTLVVEYDEASGRVARATGPAGTVVLRDLTGTGERVSAAVEVDGADMTCTWDAVRRERVVYGGGATERVRFESRRPLPVEVVQGERTWSFEWAGNGKLLTASDGKRETRFERDGGIAAIVDPGKASTRFSRNSEGLIDAWVDPDGRRTALQLDPGGRPQRIERPGGLTEVVFRTRGGLLKGVDATGIGSATLTRDRRGLPRTVESAGAANVGVQVDELGRITSIVAATGRRIGLRWEGRRLLGLDDGAIVELNYDGLRLAGWTGEDGTTLSRDRSGAVTERAGRGGWSLKRDGAGLPEQLSWFGERFDFDYDPQLSGWTSDRGRSLSLDWDGFVQGWTQGGFGPIERRTDRWGRAVELKRGSSRFTLERDRSGRVVRVVDAAGAQFLLPRAPGGQPASISGPRGLALRLKSDPAGRLAELRRGDAAWTVRRDRSGRVTELADPEGRTAILDWDRAGRWTRLQRPGRVELEANYGSAGPTAVGDGRRHYDGSGRVEGWGPQDAVGTWRLDRDNRGGVRAVRWQPARSSQSQGEPWRRTVSRDSAGVPRQLGPWTLAMRGGRLASVLLSHEDAPQRWELRRDSHGRAERLTVPGGDFASVRRDPTGDVRTVTLSSSGQEGTWELRRDGLGRVDEVSWGESRWALPRDPLGRSARWELQLEGGLAFNASFDQLDGSGLTDTSLADALEVKTDDVKLQVAPTGSRRVELTAHDHSRLLSFEELRRPTGRLESVQGFWGTTGAPAGEEHLDQSLDPSLVEDSPFESAVDPIGDALAEAFVVPPLRWGPELLAGAAGDLLLPGPEGRGPGAAIGPAGRHAVRLAAGEGGTVTWLTAGGRFEGLRLPSPTGRWLSPAGWTGTPAPPGGVDSEVRPFAPLPGPAYAVEAWWTQLGLDSSLLAHAPTSALSPRAWLRPRVALLAQAADLPEDSAPAGPGAALPAMPGVQRLVPTEAERVSLLEALVISGDLPVGSAEHRAWLPIPPSWTVELPGAAMLRELAERLASPAAPPMLLDPLAGAGTNLGGLLLAEGRRDELRHPARVEAAVSGLPAGVLPLHPGPAGPRPGAFSSLPGAARSAAIESLSDDPFSPGQAARDAALADGLLLFATGQEPRARLPLSPWLRPREPAERWVIETPTGVRAVVDGRGRLLSLDLQARLLEAWAGRGVAAAGMSVLHPLGDDPGLSAPGLLPEPSDRPESRWGLAAAWPEAPVSPLLTPLLVGLSGAVDPELGTLDPPARLPDPGRPPGAARAGDL